MATQKTARASAPWLHRPTFLLLFLFFGTPSLGFAQDFFLDASRVMESESFLNGLALSDLDEDGDPDLVTTYSQPPRIELRTGNRWGEFGSPTSVPMPVVPGQVLAADFTGDGHEDLSIVSPDSDVVLLYPGDGAGSFASPLSFSVAGSPFDQKAGDFNLDGNLDLAILCADSDTVAIVLGSGPTGFVSEQRTSTRPTALSLEVADFDADGLLDVAVSLTGNIFDEERGGVALLTGDGLGGVTQTFEIDHGDYLVGMTVGDFDGDKRIDVAAADNASGATYIFRGVPGGLVLSRTVVLGRAAVSVIAVDIDHDRDLDLISPVWSSEASAYHRVVTLLGDGAGDFPDRLELRSDGGALAIGDLNRNGDLDLVLGSFWGTLSAHFGNGRGGFQTTPTVSVQHPPHTLLTADFNQDGLTDAVTASLEGFQQGACVLLSNGLGDLSPLPVSVPPLRLLVVGDLNGDGKPDLLGVEEFGQIRPLLGNGDGTFASVPSFSGGQFATSMALGDLDEDGATDLILGGGGGLTLFLGTGNGEFTSNGFHPGFEGESQLLVADLNEDGHLDVGATNAGQGPSPPRFSILYGDGTGNLTLPLVFREIDRDPRTPVAADLDNDGHLDIVIPHHEFGAGITLIPGTGGFSLGTPSRLFLGSDRPAVQASDLNGDGNLEVLAISSNTADLAVFLGDGSGSFSQRSRFRIGVDPQALAVLDLENDGDLDVLTASLPDGNLSILRNIPAPHLACRAGNLNRAVSAATADVILLNGSRGAGDERSVDLSPSDPLLLSVASPPSNPGGTTGYVLYLQVGEPGPEDRRFLPLGIGCIGLDIPLLGGSPNRIANPIGRNLRLGEENWPGPATQFAPTNLLDVNASGRTIDFYVQGLMFDSSAPNGTFGVTNGVLVRIR